MGDRVEIEKTNDHKGAKIRESEAREKILSHSLIKIRNNKLGFTS